jgi:hypothetical protein
MRRAYVYLSFSLLFLLCQASTRAQEAVVPAGTLLHCTLDEPNFSSATADVGDPVLCRLSSLQEFGRTVFPRGSYLQGHLEAEKEPGHFVGKGYLKIQFDRIGLANTDMPLSSKIIEAHGYRVDRQGDIVGRGHAKRDVVEWLIPPLWPWKVVSLPARGPRPTLKGEEPLTLRLMEDIVVPRTALAPAPGWHFFGQPSSLSPNTPAAPAVPTARLVSAESKTAADAQAIRVTRIALKSNAIFDVANYRIDSDRLNYVLPNGQKDAVDVHDVDWRKTSQLNAKREKMPILEANSLSN